MSFGKKYTALFSLTFLLFTNCLSCDAAPAKGKKKVYGWKLSQTGAYTGNFSTYLSPVGMKVEAESLVTVIRLPDLHFCVYNPDNHTYAESDYEEWSDRFENAKAPEPLIKTGKSKVIAGIKTELYIRRAVEGGMEKLEMWLSRDLAPSEKVARVWGGFNLVPGGAGVPLRVIKIMPDGSRSIAIDTKSAKRVLLSETIFLRPKGYKKVDNELEVALAEPDELAEETIAAR